MTAFEHVTANVSLAAATVPHCSGIHSQDRPLKFKLCVLHCHDKVGILNHHDSMQVLLRQQLQCGLRTQLSPASLQMLRAYNDVKLATSTRPGLSTGKAGLSLISALAALIKAGKSSAASCQIQKICKFRGLRPTSRSNAKHLVLKGLLLCISILNIADCQSTPNCRKPWTNSEPDVQVGQARASPSPQECPAS